MIKYRQPIYENGKFKEWHYWGVEITDSLVDRYVGWLTYKKGVTDPKDSQRFTGFFDKNKKEIYEGDTLKCYDHPTGVESGIFQVHFERGCFRAGNMNLCDWGTAWTEIIGNIIENPDARMFF